MKLSLKKDIDDLKPAEVCVIFASEEQMKNPFNTAPQSVRDASSHIELELVQSKPGSCSLLPFKNAPGVILCGLGKEKDITAESLRNTGGSVTSFCRSRSIENLHCLIPSFRDMAETNSLRHIIEGSP
jgi:leucyl aminopeptidase